MSKVGFDPYIYLEIYAWSQQLRATHRVGDICADARQIIPCAGNCSPDGYLQDEIRRRFCQSPCARVEWLRLCSWISTSGIQASRGYSCKPMQLVARNGAGHFA